MNTPTAAEPPASRTRVPAGLFVAKRGDGWFVIHAASRLLLHPNGFSRRAHAVAAVRELAKIGINWQQSAQEVRVSVDQIGDGRTLVQRILTPAEQRERQRRVSANSTRYLRALEAAGEQIVGRTSYGLAGTIYQMSCGCQRRYNVNIGGPNAGEPTEVLVSRCDRHCDLHVAVVSTDIAVIRRALTVRGCGGHGGAQ